MTKIMHMSLLTSSRHVEAYGHYSFWWQPYLRNYQSFKSIIFDLGASNAIDESAIPPILPSA